MSLRTRLIIAFLLLSVVPLTVVTLFSYAASVAAVESAASVEAMSDAEDISRRMEFVTADVGRRLDRLFVAQKTGTGAPPMEEMRDRVAPMLGETASLVERVEFQPMDDAPPGAVAPPLPPMPPRPPRPPDEAGDVRPRRPPPPQPMVIDVPRIIAEARRAAQEAVASSGASGTSAEVTAGLQAAEDGLKVVAQAIEAAQPSVAARLRDVRLNVEGRRVEVELMNEGKLVGKANATLNLERTMRTILPFARRDKGEIPFAIDRRGELYTPLPAHKEKLRDLDIAAEAPLAAGGGPRRRGEWLVVAKQDPSGLTFGIARPMGSSLREVRRASVRTLSLGLLMIGLALVGIVPVSHRMTRHLTTLTAGVRQLAGGDFRARVPVRSQDEFGALAAAFNQMAADLERNQTLAIEQERLRRELELSRRIQTEMLPRAGLRLGAAEIKGISIPAREVGGDFFNYFQLPDGRLALLVGDVSGKGVSAALLMANVQATLRARLPLETDLAALAAGLDREIDESTPRGVYLTLFMAIMDADGRSLRYVNAGHNPQFALRRDGGIASLSSSGLPIALFPGHDYRELTVDIGAGDLLFFYTDGLVETENEAGEMFGAERLQAILAADRAHGIDEVLDHVERSVREFRGKAEPLDDATMMVLRL